MRKKGRETSRSSDIHSHFWNSRRPSYFPGCCKTPQCFWNLPHILEVHFIEAEKLVYVSSVKLSQMLNIRSRSILHNSMKFQTYHFRHWIRSFDRARALWLFSRSVSTHMVDLQKTYCLYNEPFNVPIWVEISHLILFRLKFYSTNSDNNRDHAGK
jgi:hypothetical protein